MAPFYARGERGAVFMETLGAQARRVPLTAAQDGDVLVFAGGIYAAHLGIRSTWHGLPAVIHAHASRRLVMEEPLSAGMGATLASAWRHLELE